MVRQNIRVNLIRALKLRNTVFTQDALVHQHGAVVRSIISCRNDSDSPCGHLPAQDQSDDALSLFYPLQKESLLHFFSVCWNSSA